MTRLLLEKGILLENMIEQFVVFLMPGRVQVDLDTLTDTYGKFSASPFERGYGATVGSLLRRALLSSLGRPAITAIKIEGVVDYHGEIKGVGESCQELILNLKQIRFLLNGREPKTLLLKAKGPCQVTANDIIHDADAEVLDKDIHLATLQADVLLSLEMRLEFGYGFVPAEFNRRGNLTDGYFPLDSNHSAIRHTEFRVEPARQGADTEFDKLTLELWTDGSTKPENALMAAARNVQSHLDIMIKSDELINLNYLNVGSNRQRENQTPVPVDNPSSGIPIEDVNFSVRTSTCLKNLNVTTLNELAELKPTDLTNLKNFGKKSLDEIKSVLAQYGLRLK